MLIKSSEFVISAVKPAQYPETDMPEIAFAGKSNVGKSSLINTLLNRKRLVKTSSTPGRTQLINFFIINNAFHFVDLPGYGYAKVPKRITKTWGPMIEAYLSKREPLKAVIVILDIRRIPNQDDQNLISWLHHHSIPVIYTLTKADKLSKSNQKKQQDKIAQTLSMDKEQLLLFSAKSRLGLPHVWSAIETKIMTEE